MGERAPQARAQRVSNHVDSLDSVVFVESSGPRGTLRAVLRALTTVLFATVAACSFRGSPSGGNGTIDASPDADMTPCDPSSQAVCGGDGNVTECRSDGSGYDLTECPLPCSGDPVCGAFVPSNQVGFGSGTGDFVVATTENYRFNSDTGQILDANATVIRAPGPGVISGIGFRVQVQVGGPDIGVFEFQSLTLEELSSVRARGANALAIVATGPIQIDGRLNASGGTSGCVGTGPVNSCAGPGGGNGGAPETNGASRVGNQGVGEAGESGNNTAGEGGGGGGAYARDGGDGGDATNVDGGDGGRIWGASPVLVPLVGGAGAGGGATEDTNKSGSDCPGVNPPYLGGIGGGGGGGVQIVSAVSVVLAGSDDQCVIDVGGGGGTSGACSAAGGGGGAGGGLMIEAPTISIAGACALVANGGGGGGSDSTGDGNEGSLTAAPATGGGSGSSGGATGGALSQGAGDAANVSSEAGGGGGGVGYILLRATSTGISNMGIVSPAPAEPALVVQ